jgi:hypothetical protein
MPAHLRLPTLVPGQGTRACASRDNYAPFAPQLEQDSGTSLAKHPPPAWVTSSLEAGTILQGGLCLYRVQCVPGSTPAAKLQLQKYDVMMADVASGRQHQLHR